MFLIFTDSMSCLQALDHLKIDHPIIEEIISKLTSLKASGFDIHLCWLPGHVGIRGNERADRDESPLNKLHEIAPIVNEPRTHHLSTRSDQSVVKRPRPGLAWTSLHHHRYGCRLALSSMPYFNTHNLYKIFL